MVVWAGPDPTPTLAAVRSAIDNDLDMQTARHALDLLAGAILAGVGSTRGAVAGLAEAAGLLGIHLETMPDEA